MPKAKVQPKPRWTTRHADVAAVEGWAITHMPGSDQGEMQVHMMEPEDCIFDHGFTEDRDAWRHIVRRANDGSELHKHALAVLSAHNPAEYQRMIEASAQ